MRIFIIRLKDLIGACCDDLFYRYLKRVRKKDDIITIEVIEKFKEIEKLAYPEKIRPWQNCENADDILNVCSCFHLEQIYYCMGENWYFVCTDNRNRVTLIDFASSDGVCRDIMHIINFVALLSKGRGIAFLAREITSYRLIRSMDKKKRIKIYTDKCYFIDGEFFHQLLVRVNPKYFKRSKTKISKLRKH